MKNILISFFVFVVLFGVAKSYDYQYQYTKNQIALLDEHNKHRRDKGLELFRLDKNLCNYAQKHAEKMAEKTSMQHSSMKSLKDVNKDCSFVGENIAWGQKDAKEVVDTWMNSSGHRRNILNEKFKMIGFGIKEDKSGNIYWCVVFSD